jgi:hypothetical protein
MKSQRRFRGSYRICGLKTYDRGHAHGRTGVARVGLEGGVHLGRVSACVVDVMEELFCYAVRRSRAEQQCGPLHWGSPNKRTARVRMVLIARVSVLSKPIFAVFSDGWSEWGGEV